MSVFEQIIRLYAPFTCVGCGEELDTLLCSSCAQHLPIVPSRCYKCKATTRDYATCTTCRSKSSLSHVYVAVHYTDLPKELLKVTKYQRARGGTVPIATAMAPLLSACPEDVLLVPIPTATGRVRQRGYDQAELLAKEISSQTGLTRANCLARQGQAHQVGATRAERLRHLEGAFRAVYTDRLQDKHIVLVDDVLTTGATVETAARILKKAGARQVDAVVFAQPS